MLKHTHFITIMSNFIEKYSTDLIEDSELIFHTDLNEDGNHFGIMKLKIAKVPITNKTCFLYFSVDNSGSMEESHRGKSKLSFVKTTLKNMIHFLVKQEADIYIQIQSFNSKVESLVHLTHISEENVTEIIEKINSLDADNDTDIGNAIVVANEFIENYRMANPEHEIGHIFMSDGSPTSGITTPNQLAELVNDEFSNTFIGFGLDHNAHLFHKFSEKNNTEYRFIDKIENTALVYGEIIHQLLYPALRDVVFRVSGGEIYDWKTNTWTTQMTEPVIVSESEKVYHVRSLHSVSEIQVDIMQHGDSEAFDVVRPLPAMVSLVDGSIIHSCLEDVTKYIYRQRTMECLFESKKKLNSEGKRELKQKMRNLFKEMRTYMRDHDLLEEPMLKLLCDDIFITYKTMNSAYGMMFAVARCSSQGRQQTYNTTLNNDEEQMNIDDYDSDGETVILNYRRPNTRSFSLTQEIEGESIVDDDELDSYISSPSNTTCYSTPTILDTMKQMSQLP